MSASKEKRRRQELYASGQLEKNPEETVRKKAKRKNWIIGSVFAVILVGLTVFFAVFNTGFIERHTTAATVGEHKLSAALYNFFYRDVYSSIANSMGISGVEVDLSQMPYDETGKTYADYIQEEVGKTISQTYALVDAAKAEGFVLPEADQSYVDTAAQALDANAPNYGAANGAAYLTQMYGKGSNMKTFEQYVTLMQTSTSYANAHAESLLYDDDTLSQYYEENKATLDTVSYHVYASSVPTDELDAEGNAVYDLEAAKAQADAIAAADSEEAFIAQITELVDEESKASYANGSATKRADQTAAVVPAELSAWLFDENRQYGDTTVAPAGETGYNAVYFVDNTAKYDVEMVNVRHILIMPADTTDEASVAKATQKAEEILATYQAGEQTEDAFAALAKQESQDEGTKINGGLMENMRPGQTVEAFDAWSFDAVRQPGDVGVVESIYGAHVMYFSENAGNYQNYRILTAIRSRDTNTWAEELGNANTIAYHNSGLKLVKK